MLALIAAIIIAQQAPAEPRICDQVHLWTTAEEAEAIRRCEAERTPREQLRREQEAEPGRVAGQSNAPAHRAARVSAMNGRCDEARAQAAAIGDVPLSEWVAQRCGVVPPAAAPARPRPTPPPATPPLNLWD